MGKIYDVLLRDTAYPLAGDPIVITNALNEKAERWRISARRHFPCFQDEINRLIAESLVETSKPGIAVNPAHFELTLINKLGKQLPAKADVDQRQLAAFGKHTASVLDAYAESAEITRDSMFSQAARVDLKNNDIVKGLTQFAEEVRGVSHDVGTWADRIGEGARALAGVPAFSELDFLKDIDGAAKKVKGVSAEVKQGAEAVLSIARSVMVEAEIEVGISAPVGGGRGAAGGAALDEVQKFVIPNVVVRDEFRAKLPEIQHTLTQVGQGIEVAGLVIGRITGNSKLAQDIVTAGKAGIDIVSNIASIAAGSLAAGPIAPIVGIVGAIGSIFGSLFGQGPSVEEIIKEEFRKLSEHMDERFDQVEELIVESTKALGKHIDKHFEAVHGRFDHLEVLMGEYHRKCLELFITSHGMLDTIQADLQKVLDKIGDLRNEVIQCFGAIESADYILAKETVLTRRIDLETAPHVEHGYYTLFIVWANDKMKNLIKAGQPAPGNDPANVARVVLGADGGDGLGLDLNMNAIRGYLESLRDDRALALVDAPPRLQLFNPSGWDDAVTTLLNFCKRTPYSRLERDGVIELLPDQVERLVEDGKAFNSWIVNLRKNSALFNHLLDEYKTAVESVIRAGMRTAFHDLRAEGQLKLDDKPANGALDLEKALERIEFLRKFKKFGKGEVTRDLDMSDVAISSAEEFAGKWNEGGSITREMPMRLFQHLHSLVNWDHMAHTFSGSGANRNEYTAAKDGPTWNTNYNEIVRKMLVKKFTDKVYPGIDTLQKRYAALKKSIDDLATKDSRLLDVNEALMRHEAHKAEGLPDLRVVRGFLKDIERDPAKKQRAVYDARLTTNIADVPREALVEALVNLDTTYKILSIVTALAFSYDYAGDGKLQAFLKALWNAADFNVYNGEEFRLVYMQDEVLGLLEEFRQYLLGKVKVAGLKAERDIACPVHPMVDKTLIKLQEFQQGFIKRPAPAEAQPSIHEAEKTALARPAAAAENARPVAAKGGAGGGAAYAVAVPISAKPPVFSPVAAASRGGAGRSVATSATARPTAIAFSGVVVRGATPAGRRQALARPPAVPAAGSMVTPARAAGKSAHTAVHTSTHGSIIAKPH